jgi:hypothetical protein
MQLQKLGFDEVVDTLADVLEVIEQIHVAVRDGIQITDAGILFSIAPKVMEIRRDWDVFTAQLADLSPAESDDVAHELGLRLGRSTDGIVKNALEGLRLVSEWHLFVSDGIDLGARTIAFGKALFPKKEEAAPDEGV